MQNTFVIIIDDESSAFLADQGVADPAPYVAKLIQQEKERQEREGLYAGSERAGTNAQDLSNRTPDASGYPQMKQAF
jgi:hypothetical protein